MAQRLELRFLPEPGPDALGLALRPIVPAAAPADWPAQIEVLLTAMARFGRLGGWSGAGLAPAASTMQAWRPAQDHPQGAAWHCAGCIVDDAAPSALIGLLDAWSAGTQTPWRAEVAWSSAQQAAFERRAAPGLRTPLPFATAVEMEGRSLCVSIDFLGPTTTEQRLVLQEVWDAWLRLAHGGAFFAPDQPPQSCEAFEAEAASQSPGHMRLCAQRIRIATHGFKALVNAVHAWHTRTGLVEELVLS
jgi:hypothetical protein